MLLVDLQKETIRLSERRVPSSTMQMHPPVRSGVVYLSCWVGEGGRKGKKKGGAEQNNFSEDDGTAQGHDEAMHINELKCSIKLLRNVLECIGRLSKCVWNVTDCSTSRA